jgi:uncharacterized protein YodC (DUF2158 family)
MKGKTSMNNSEGKEIRVGTVVYCKSLKCRMTVDTNPIDGYVPCVWFDKENQIHRGTLEINDLEFVNS